VRVLALADKRPPVDVASLARQAHVDAIVLLGDLDVGWIDSIRSVDVPRLGVHGNHDAEDLLRELEVEDLHLRRTSLGGLTFAGFEGSVRYTRTGARFQYSQKQASKLASRLPGADVLLAHSPPFGVNDDPSDVAHVGFEGLLTWVQRHRPRHVLHGHTHPMPGRVATQLGITRVHFVSGARLLTLD
jgi:Icc-related predicted phosphoesterase